MNIHSKIFVRESFDYAALFEIAGVIIFMWSFNRPIYNRFHRQVNKLCNKFMQQFCYVPKLKINSFHSRL